MPFLPRRCSRCCVLPPTVRPRRREHSRGIPMRIVIMVDNSETPLEPLPQVRRGLQGFINALPPNHELMLVTTGGQMNIRVQPTRD
jgi:hypothetical protein